jgi:hypothetical protein
VVGERDSDQNFEMKVIATHEQMFRNVVIQTTSASSFSLHFRPVKPNARMKPKSKSDLGRAKGSG